MSQGLLMKWLYDRQMTGSLVPGSIRFTATGSLFYKAQILTIILNKDKILALAIKLMHSNLTLNS